VTATLVTRDGATIAYVHTPGLTPGVLFCPGFYSDMTGSKALALESWCRAQGRQFTRFDYFGHGQSSGDIRCGTIGRWRDDTVAVLDAVAEGPQVLVGSSMGGWLMLLAALARPGRVAGLVGIAAAPDFTERMLAEEFSPAMREDLLARGAIELPSGYDDGRPYHISLDFLEEARQHLLLGQTIPIEVPVRLLHGQLDDAVPWTVCLRLAERLATVDVEVCLIKAGDHRLSEAADLVRLSMVVQSLLDAVVAT
jgi:pimeloyl-ACP methyl ester carboxylesterase